MQLYINSPGTVIRQKDECFRLKHEDKSCDISPLKIDSMILSNKALISTQAVALALTHNIDVIFLDEYGTPIGRVWFSKMGSTALIRRKQLEAGGSLMGIKLVSEKFIIENGKVKIKDLPGGTAESLAGSLKKYAQKYEPLDKIRIKIQEEIASESNKDQG